jgi:tRNA C32,U32 (ribose-2'-O)-methylase TrmJ
MTPNCNANNCNPDACATAVAGAKVLNNAKVLNTLWGWKAVIVLGVDY